MIPVKMKETAAEVAEVALGSAASLVHDAALVVGAVVQARGARRAKRQSKKVGQVSSRTLDQPSRYANLSLDEEKLMADGMHVLVTYIMKPKAGYDYLATAAHFAADFSTGAKKDGCTTDDVATLVDALVYYIDPVNEEMRIAYPTRLFDHNITDGRAMMCSVLALSIGDCRGMGDVEYGKIYDIHFPPPYLRLFDGPACNFVDMWRILGRAMVNDGLVVGTIIKSELGLRPTPAGGAGCSLWQGHDVTTSSQTQRRDKNQSRDWRERLPRRLLVVRQYRGRYV